MNITLVSLDNLGMNECISSALEKQGHNVRHINFRDYRYKYPSVFHRVYNFILKAFFKKNLKTLHHGKEILKELEKNHEIQDVILTIKGDFIDSNSILKFKKFTKKSIGFFNDNIYRCPKIKRVIPSFDEVYSFEKEDCANFNLSFAPNWIYTKNTSSNKEIPAEYGVFNISTIDKRLSTLIRIANELKSKNINFKFIVYDKKNEPKTGTDGITYINKHVPLSEVNDYADRSKVLLDIHRDGQIGLTFRIFESLELEKKLITTNTDIKNYDFYNPNNILIIDKNNPIIPTSFFENKYEKIPESIYKKYTVEGWIENVIFKNINCKE
jgi:thiol-disulfide isomerase/thioredoxin